jgi:hypothetical protein
MLYVAKFAFLAIDIVQGSPTILGGPLFLCGCARVDVDVDTITVVAATGQRECTHIGGTDVRHLAKQLLREMHRQRAGA